MISKIENILKSLLLVSLFTHFFLITFNNILDYNSNFDYVLNVMSMQDTFSGNSLLWRAIHTNWVYHLFFGIIIIFEFLVTIIFFRALLFIFRKQRQAWALAELGCLSVVVFYFFSFLVVGGEWFLMWQATKYNGTIVAFRFIVIYSLFYFIFKLKK